MNDQLIFSTDVPFLVAKANPPVDDEDLPQGEQQDIKGGEKPVSIFHTRCGHPRRRDDWSFSEALVSHQGLHIF